VLTEIKWVNEIWERLTSALKTLDKKFKIKGKNLGTIP